MVPHRIKQTILWAIPLILIYFALRLFNIMSLPIFTDEAIYTRWAQIASQDANWRFISLTDGKQPLFIWLDVFLMKFVNDPLLAGRLVSVVSGFATVIGIFLLACELFKKRIPGNSTKAIFGHLLEQRRVGLFSAIFLIFYPFSLVMDRMSMYDSLVATTMVWALYIEVLLVRYMRLDLALFAGVAIGSAVLTKTSGFFSIYLLPLSLLLFDFKAKEIKGRLVKWVGLATLSILIGYSIYSVLRLSPFYYIIDEKNGLFVYPLGEWIKHPFEFVSGNFHALIEWMLIYVSIPVFLLFVSSFLVDNKFVREKLLLLAWFVIPFFALGIFGKLVYPRFILFMTMPILILSAYSINYFFENIKSKVIFSVISIIALAIWIRADYLIVTNFSYAPIPASDLNQYMNSWPAGGGVKEMVQFFNSESKKGEIYVASQGTFGSLPTTTIEIYLGDNMNIKKRGIYPLPDIVPSDLKEKALIMPVYLVTNDSEEAPPLWPLTLVGKYQKGIGDRHLSIYKVNP